MSMILGLKLPKKILTLFSKWRIIIMRQPYFPNGNKPQFNIFCYVASKIAINMIGPKFGSAASKLLIAIIFLLIFKYVINYFLQMTLTPSIATTERTSPTSKTSSSLTPRADHI